MGEKQEFKHGCGILCPSCGYGIISKYYVNADIYEYEPQLGLNSRISQTIHMTCPYCGDSILCSDVGNVLTYNYIDPQYKNMKYKVLKLGIVHVIDDL